MTSPTIFKTYAAGIAAACLLVSPCTAKRRPQSDSERPRALPLEGLPSTTLSGTITQLNYNREGEICGFLLNKDTLVDLTPEAQKRLSEGLHSGDRVQVVGVSNAKPAASMKLIRATSLEDRSSGKKFAEREPGAPAPYTAAGQIVQLNYGPDGNVNGFLLDNGALANVPAFGAANPTSIRPGARISLGGLAHTSPAGRVSVEVTSLTADGQTITFPAAPPPPAGKRRPGLRPPPPPPSPAAAPSALPPDQRAVPEPPLPPPPPAI